MSCCGGSCSCGSCGCGVMSLGFEENTSTPGSMVLGVSPDKGAGEVSEMPTESGEAGNGCSCGPGCSCSPAAAEEAFMYTDMRHA